MPSRKSPTPSPATHPRKAAPPPAAGSGTRPAKSLAAFAVMTAAILAVYWPLPPEPNGPGDSGIHVLLGLDHLALHSRRIGYARDALFGPNPHLPAWYTRELMGTPFWSNLQNFPFIPTRLVLLLGGPYTGYAPAVLLAAALAGAFTFLYARRIGLGAVAAAAAGWTFACAGFFAARVMAGHLPLLEAYPALPLLLWLAELGLRPRATPAATTGIGPGAPAADVPHADRLGFKLLAMGLATACIALAGHPQVPAYALTVAFLYVLWHGRRSGDNGSTARRRQVAAAMVLGVGVAAFALWPMLRLTARSTRVLALDPPDNDVPLPFGRLAAFLLPWRDGWPAIVAHRTGGGGGAGGAEVAVGAAHPFTGYPNAGYFWDTVCYVGWLPILAALLLLVGALLRRQRLARPWPFLIAAGVLALVLALPPARALSARLPGTFFRSPARQLYVTGFVLALALGSACDLVLRRAGAPPAASGARLRRWAAWTHAWTYPLVAVALAVHAADLGSHDRAFVVTMPLPEGFSQDPAAAEDPAAQAEGGRAAIDYALVLPLNRQIDDVGFFESIMLARPYRLLVDLADLPPTRNIQAFDGSTLSRRALASLGVKLVVTPAPRPDLNRLGDAAPGVSAYGVSDPAPRAAFFPAAAAGYVDPAAVHAAVRQAGEVSRSTVLLPATHTAPASAPAGGDRPGAAVSYRRPDSDEILLGVRAEGPGYVRVLESWDPGWAATVDGAPADVLIAEDAFLCVPVPAGSHEVRLRYHTPGTGTGVAVSLASLGLLALLIAKTPKRQARSDRPQGAVKE